MKKLFKISGRNRYCGPSAMSATMGITTHEASRIVREATGKSSVKGMYNTEMIKALASAGVRFRYVTYKNKPTFKQWHSEHYFGQRTILQVTNHYIALGDDEWADSKNKKPKCISTAKQRVRVHAAIFITLVPPMVVPVKEAKPAFTGSKLDLDDIVRHYCTADVVDYYDDRICSMQETDEYEGFLKSQRYAFDDINEMGGFDGSDLQSWRTANLLARKWGAL